MKRSLIVIAALVLFVSFTFDTGNQENKQVRRVITLENTPVKRPYSPAIEANNTLYVSGQIAIDQATGQLVEGKIEEQTRQVLKNLKSVIEKAGYSMENVAKCTVLLSDIAFYSTVNQIYMEFFPRDPPARMAFAVKDLPMGALIEIDAIAVK
ncbi:MAG: reactive intermediate/imine deaminase [Odoribacter sp.]|nr:reactive intermediate/imine deaminase [Odoribacter sp.]